MNISRIYYKHYRYKHNMPVSVHDVGLRHYTQGKTKWQPACRGGKTECHLVLDNDTEIVGVAECSPKDAFVYKVGRDISLGRAMKKFCYWQQANSDYAKLPF